MDRIVQSQRLVGGAGDSKRVTFCPPNAETYKLVGISVMPNETSATNGTNYVGVRPYKGASTAVAADRNTSATSLTQGTADDVTVTATGVDLEITKAAPLTVRAVQVASGVAYDLSVVVEFDRMGVI